MSDTLLTPSSNNKIEKEVPKDSPLRRLIKIFRTNTVVKHHFQSHRSEKPVGVAKAFFKSGYQFQSSVIPGYGEYDRFARYSDYAEMESYPILNKALDIIADEVTQKDEDGQIIKVKSPDKDIQQIIQELFDDVLHLNGKELPKIVRQTCKYGDSMFLIDATEDHGVVNLINMPANEVEREEGFDKEEPTAVRFRWSSRGNIEIPNAYVAHFRLDGNDLFKPYGQSFLESARRPWRQLVLMEDAMMVYRITRAPERRVYYLDIMGIPPENVEEVVKKFNETIKKEKVVNDQGKIDLRYGSTMSMEEDFVIPTRGKDSATRIDTLPGGQNASDIEDIEFIKKNLFAALGIPKAFLTFDEDVGAKSILTHEDIRFARTVARIQGSIINELVKIAMIHLYIKGYRGKDLVNFEIKMTNPSTVAELQKNELWRARMELVQTAGDGVFDTSFIYKNFLHLTDESIDMIRKGQIMDKMFQAKLLQIEGGGMMGMDGLGGMGMGGMGGMGSMGLGGMGGGMDMGLGGGMDLGGAPPNVGGLGMEGLNPAAKGFGGGDSSKMKDLTRRNSDERIADERGVAELPSDFADGADDAQDVAADSVDMAGLEREYTSPMGTNESVNIIDSFKSLLSEYRSLGRSINSEVADKLLYKTYPFLKPTARKAANCDSITSQNLIETFGDIGKEQEILSEISTRSLLEREKDRLLAEHIEKIEQLKEVNIEGSETAEEYLEESMNRIDSKLTEILKRFS